ncbi:DNA-3-methyladenine glycosylase I [Limosilactobacillus sp.]|uniref:DNA-3-methyladenine glycosylase I n=1 Tax=Limosilactobacillus sp. TaxID=2773925 RepID=UPI00345E94EC
MVKRCFWKGMDNPLYQQYHDQEWGKLNLDEHYLYEMLVLESFQSGLSWLTVLKKRENFRKAFADFDVDKVAAYGDEDVARLMNDKGIIRNRRKIEAAIHNAQVFVKMHRDGQTMGQLLQRAVPDVIINHPRTMTDMPAQTALSQRLSRQLKKVGFKFVGPVTVYSYLQAVGLVNDHLEDCDFKYGQPGQNNEEDKR